MNAGDLGTFGAKSLGSTGFCDGGVAKFVLFDAIFFAKMMPLAEKKKKNLDF